MKPTLITHTQNSLIIPDNLIGYWNFNESASDIVYDYSGNNRHGTFSPTAPTRVSGRMGRALSFNGSNNFVKVNYGSLLNGVTNFTIVVWFKPGSLADWRGIVGKYVDDNHCITLQTNANGNISLDIDDTAAGSNYGRTTGSVYLVTNQWVHIAEVYDGNGATNTDKVRLYVNGIDRPINYTGNPVSASSINAAPILFGDLSASLVPVDGVIDEVRIYARSLTAAEVLTLYNAR